VSLASARSRSVRRNLRHRGESFTAGRSLRDLSVWTWRGLMLRYSVACWRSS